MELVEAEGTGGETEEEATVELLVSPELCGGTTVTKDAIEAPSGVVSADMVVTADRVEGVATTDGVLEVFGRVLTDDWPPAVPRGVPPRL